MCIRDSILTETNKYYCSTTFKVIKASRPLFPLLLPSVVTSSISIAEKSWDLKTKIHNLSKEYFSSNKKNIPKIVSKNLIRKKIPYTQRKRRSKPLNKKKIYIWPHARAITLSGIGLHTEIYKTFPGKIIGNLEKTITNLSNIYNADGKTKDINKEILTLTTNLLLLFIIINGCEQLMLPVYLLRFLTALRTIYIETNNAEYLTVYTQVLWIGVSLLQINMFYEKFFKEALQPTKKV